MKLLNIARYVLVLCFVSSTLPAMEESPLDIMQDNSYFSVLPHELFDVIILDYFSSCNNIHGNLQAVASLYQVSKFFKQYFNKKYPELMFVLHGIDQNDEDYKEKISRTRGFLAKKNLFINTRSTRAQTLLHKAAWHSKSKIVKTLFDLGANPHVFDFLNYSVYTIAQEKKCHEILKYLDSMFAGRRRKPIIPNKAYSKALVERNLEAFEQWLNKQTKKSIHDASEIYDWLTRTIESKKKLEEYINHIQELGLPLNIQSVCHTACIVNNIPVIDYLLEQDDRIIQNKLGDMLIIAAAHDNASRMPQIIERGADINATDDNGYTALMWTANNGCPEVARILIERGASVNFTTVYGATALIMSAIRGQHLVAQLLIGCGANINATDDNGDTALILAAKNGHSKVVEILLKYAASINVTNIFGNTALILAKENGHSKVVELLQKKLLQKKT